MVKKEKDEKQKINESAEQHEDNESQEEDFQSMKKELKKHKNKKVKNLGEVMTSLLAEKESIKVRLRISLLNFNIKSRIQSWQRINSCLKNLKRKIKSIRKFKGKN